MDPVLALGEDLLHVEPGSEARVIATVRNAGDLVEQYRLEVLGEAARWSQVVPRQISVLPGGAEEKSVTVVFRPPAPPVAVAGEFPFGLRCVSLEAPDRCAVVEGDVVVGAVIGVQAKLEPLSPSGRWTGRYRVLLENTGSVPVRLRLAASDNRRVLRFALAPAEVTVEPGRSTPVYLSVQSRQPMLRGKAVAHGFAVTYETVEGDRRGELAGVFEQRPILSKGVIVVALLLVVVAAAGVALLLRGRGGPEDPPPTGVPPPPIAMQSVTAHAGGSVELSWQRSPYAQGYLVQQLLPNGTVAGSKEIADRDQVVFTWSSLKPGRHCFRVLAVGPAGRSAPSEALCTTLAKPPPTATPTPTATAPAATAPAPAPAPPPPVAPVPVPPLGGGDPVQGAYVIYAATAIDDRASQGVAESIAAQLQQAGVPARLVDSRQSDRLTDANAGLLVVLRDGFPSFQTALDECNAHRDIAPKCVAFDVNQ
ncbi:MAG TPA: fibronectin type III domain-containing protein [Pilimelia sp.]|nr:fibronectin type III domain-containing protein [Pilimelia sp.]